MFLCLRLLIVNISLCNSSPCPHLQSNLCMTKLLLSLLSPLYTFPNAPSAIRFSCEKLLVADNIFSRVNTSDNAILIASIINLSTDNSWSSNDILTSSLRIP
ncbi:hypothetical protein HanPSC8_Chr14g0613711 [Helianthus annuus]|nr:hypothetical protein HanPSC8_Chr14g0613711 [Helianthus annuus]